MPFDDSTVSGKNFYFSTNQHLLLVDKKFRIVKETKRASYKPIILLCLIVNFTFLILCGWSTMIQPMVLNG